MKKRRRSAKSQRKNKNLSRSRRLASFEQLEDRRMLAVRFSLVAESAAAAVNSTEFILDVFNLSGAPDQEENILIDRGSDGNMQIWDIANGAYVLTEHPPEFYTKFTFNGGPLKDEIRNNTGIPGIMNGNGGNDILIGGSGNDIIRGGQGKDLIKGREGDDWLFGDGGQDQIGGGDGYDVIFGGADGRVDILRGGAGGRFNKYEADRILVHQVGTNRRGNAGTYEPGKSDIVQDQTPEDAVIVFTDATVALASSKDDGTNFFYAAGGWSNAEVERFDKVFDSLYQSTRDSNPAIPFLKTGPGTHQYLTYKPAGEKTENLEFIRWGSPTVSGVSTLAFNYTDTGVMGFPQTGFESSLSVEQTLYHELGHNFDDFDENPFADQFAAISGWTQTRPAGPISSFDDWQSLLVADEPWAEAARFDAAKPWYFRSDTEFTRSYGATNRFEDFATTFSYVFLGSEYKDQGPDFFDLESGVGIVDGKVNSVRQLQSTLSSRDLWKATLRFPVGTDSPRPILTWDRLVGSTGYELWIYNASTDETVVREAKVLGNTYQLEQDLENGFYQFWLRGLDEAGRAYNWSEPREFRVSIGIDEAPVIIGPSGETTDDPIRFEWEAVTGAANYMLEVERFIDGEYQQILNTNGGTELPIADTFWVAPTGAPKGEYRFRVFALNDTNQPGPASIDTEFSVPEPPSIIVNRLTDVVSNDGFCTLREALIAVQSNQDSGARAGECQADTRSHVIEFERDLSGTIALTHADGSLPTIVENTTIIGPGANNLAIDGLDTHRIFNIAGQAGFPFDVTIIGMTLQNGRAQNSGTVDEGGAIRSRTTGLVRLQQVVVQNNVSRENGGAVASFGTTFEIVESIFRGNRVDGGSVGGAIHAGTMTIIDSTFEDNRAPSGGAIYAESVIISGSTFALNQATGGGGAVFVTESADITRSTFSENIAGGSGGGLIVNALIGSADRANVFHSTFTKNEASSGGGIHSTDGASLTIIASIIAGNTASSSGPDMRQTGDATIAESLIGDKSGIAVALPGDSSLGNIVGDSQNGGIVDPDLEPLAGNNGRTPTHALRPSSLALNKLSQLPPGEVDQRGVLRTFGGSGDMGAFELDAVAPTVVTSTADLIANDGFCTFREAVTVINLGSPLSQNQGECVAATGSDTIIFAANLNGPIAVTEGTIEVTKPLHIAGPGADQLTISGAGNGEAGVFLFTGRAANYRISGLTIEKGNAGANGQGGAIDLSAGPDSRLRIDGVTLRDNQAGDGGAIYVSESQLRLTNSALINNQSTSVGGGLSVVNGQVSVANVTFSGNRGDGAAISNLSDGNQSSRVAITNSTFAVNSGSSIIRTSGTGVGVPFTAVKNSILAKNTGNIFNADARNVSQGHNVIDDGSLQSTHPTDQNADPLLGTLATVANGTVAHPLITGSPAINSGWVANSILDWSATGTQGENSWRYGYYNRTADPDGFYQTSNFEIFAEPDWTFTSEGWDWANGNPPWTFVGESPVHPTGNNNGQEHWAIRRWTSDVDATVNLVWSVAKVGTFGNGITGKVLLNGVEVDSVVISGTNETGVERSLTLELATGDLLDFAVTPKGLDGVSSDIADGTNLTAVIELVNDQGTAPRANGEAGDIGAIEFDAADNSTVVGITVSPASVDEDGSSNLVYTFTRTGDPSSPLTLQLLVSGTATFNDDYTQSGAATFSTTSATVRFEADAPEAVLTIDPVVDPDMEPDETVVLTIVSAEGATISLAEASAAGTIADDDLDATDPTIQLPAGETIVTNEGGTIFVRNNGDVLFQDARENVTMLEFLGGNHDTSLAVGDLQLLNGNAVDLTFDGQGGHDRFRLLEQDQSLDLTTLATGRLQNVEAIDITGSGDNVLTLTAQKVLDLSTTTDTLVVQHDVGDTVNYGDGWEVEMPELVGGQYLHVLTQAGATVHVINTQAWQNPVNPLDANRDGSVSPVDALVVINTVNVVGSRSLATPTAAEDIPTLYFDPSGDDAVSPLDALLVINFLNNPTGNPEGEDGPTSELWLPANDSSSEHVTTLHATRNLADLVVPTPADFALRSPPSTNGPSLTDARKPVLDSEDDFVSALEELFQDDRQTVWWDPSELL